MFDKRLATTLGIIKFLCKDIWILLFKKQVDSLKTNHQGVYILHDSKFRWFVRMSSDEGGLKAAQLAQPFMWLPCGIIQGLLSGLGLPCVVHAETAGLPQFL
ncbi:hypothetical protein EV182_000418 [Spiromyces aspiralis]|uniref:Uncharacterized protein n=1 Tax=Spiromyces aspiralis TaxID=68401 RepID=A0ACC1HPI9_9FUNG|nr:hypothetical protein EV182_000418 [Spiromyces aspiralis]